MISITGCPAASIQFPLQLTPLFNTPTRPIICRATPISTPTAPGLLVEALAMDGGPSAQASAGLRLPWANGCGIPASAGLLPATNRGAGLLTTMAAGDR